MKLKEFYVDYSHPLDYLRHIRSVVERLDPELIQGLGLTLLRNLGSIGRREARKKLAHGVPVPDTDAPHTQLGRRTSSRTGERYPQAREFDSNGRPVRDVDFTDHGRPKEHADPHQHRYDPETGKRLPAEPLPEKPKPPAQ